MNDTTTYYTVNVTITEANTNIYEVRASYINDCGTEYVSVLMGEIDPWSDSLIPVYKELAVHTLHKALLTKFNINVRVKYPDIDDKYDGFQPGIIKEFKYVHKFTC